MNRADSIPLVNLERMHKPLRPALDRALADCLDHNRYINGREVGEFESAFGAFLDVPQVVGVSSGTDALTLALKALGIGRGHQVILPDMTFLATAEAVALAGARPVLLDVEAGSGILDPALLKAALSGTGCRAVKAVIYVALYGSPRYLPEISGICREYGLPLICDAAQAHGATVGGRSIVHFADITCFSFFPGKNLGALGDAGAVACADLALAERIRLLRDHGRTEKYRHQILGGNSRLDTIQAAVLLVKLPWLEAWNAHRKEMAALYRRVLAPLPGIAVIEQEDALASSAFHLFVVRATERDCRRRHLQSQGIGCGIHYPVPIHRQPACAFLGYDSDAFPVAATLSDGVLSLPLDGTIREDEIMRVAVELGAALSGTESATSPGPGC